MCRGMTWEGDRPCERMNIKSFLMESNLSPVDKHFFWYFQGLTVLYLYITGGWPDFWTISNKETVIDGKPEARWRVP